MDSERRRRVSLKDIAGASGLSISTVSEILNGKRQNYSSEATRKLVFKVASELGYRPNFGYKVMLGQRTKTVAIVSVIRRVMADEHIKGLILALSERFESMGYASYVCTLSMDADANMAHIQELISRGVEHFVMIGTPLGHERIQALLKDEGRTFIGYSPQLERRVEVDSSPAIEGILRFFLSEGRSNFKMVIGDPAKDNFMSDRFLALRRVFPDIDCQELCARHIVPLDCPDGADGDFETYAYRQGHLLTASILDGDPGVQAIFHSNDYFALGGLSCLLERGVSVGKDVAIAGANNIQAVKFNPFPVSTVEHDMASVLEMLSREATSSQPFQTRLESAAIIRTPKDMVRP